MMSKIQVNSTLSYEVSQPTIFLFKIAAATTPHQSISNETLTFDPNLNAEQYQVGEDGNRMHRVVVQPCNLTVRYEAIADISPELEHEQGVDETSPSRVTPKRF